MKYTAEEFKAIALCCFSSNVGKVLPLSLYIHISALPALNSLLREYEYNARELIKAEVPITIIKFSTDKPKISYLYYPEFDTNPHPPLESSTVVDMETHKVSKYDYQTSDNPPILHRKETFVTADYPLYQEFAVLTQYEEEIGLLSNPRLIGTYAQWQERLNYQRIGFVGHYLVCHLDKVKDIKIDRHKAAITRNDLSRPVRKAIESGVLTPQMSFFDYGCGYGEDVKRLQSQGYNSAGWDPYYFPENSIVTADVVNLGYVINVIENQSERREALIKAWELTNEILLVSAQVLLSDNSRGWVAYGDGVITGRNTFQKYYEQEELKSYIDVILGVDSIAVGLGIYFVFRSLEKAETFRASRFHSRVSTPRVKKSYKRFEDYEELLSPLMAFVANRGRIPVRGELINELELKAELGTFRRAFQVILEATNADEWEAIALKRRQELLLYLALSSFAGEIKLRQFSPAVRQDIKALFGDFKLALLLVNQMLLNLKDLDKIAQICHDSPIGSKVSGGLLVHVSGLDCLDPLLRLYEGAASRVIGAKDNANVIKFHNKASKISYLFYPNFDSDPHPILESIVTVDLRSLKVSYTDYSNEENPPILHKKDSLVTPEYPLYEKFSKLTRQEKDWGLLEDLTAISRLEGWLKCLENHYAEIQGHRLVWRKDADAYKIKLLKSQIRRRQKK